MRSRPRRFAARLVAGPAVVLAVATVAVGGAPPAAAHGAGGVEATNYDVRVVAVEPEAPGVTVRVVDLDRIELRNESGTEVTVAGYGGEPYLRVGPDGVFRNTRSPATYLNRSTDPTGSVPARYDTDATAEWERIGTEPVVRWHDHRAHWMGDEPDATSRTVLNRWTIDLERAGRDISVTGETAYVPPPSPLPAALGAVALAAATIGLGLTRWWRAVLLASLAACTLANLIVLVGEWRATSGSPVDHLSDELYTIGGVVVGTLALVVLARARDPLTATPAVLFAGVVLFVSGGLLGVPSLGHSRLPTTLDPAVVRALTVVCLGLAPGAIAVSALHLRRPAVVGSAEP